MKKSPQQSMQMRACLGLLYVAMTLAASLHGVYAWTSQDIGAVGIAGSSSYANGAYTLTASGASFGANTDQARFVYLPSTGDCSITVRVASLTGSHWGRRAGIMVRENLTTASKMAFMGMFDGMGVFFQAHSETNDVWSTGYYGTGNEPIPQYVRLVRDGNLFTGYKSVDGVVWYAIGSKTVSMSANIFVGLVAMSGTNSSTATAVLDNFSALGVPIWTGVDIGTVGIAGSTSENAGTITQTGSGASFWGNTDQIRFAYQQVRGDCTIVAQLGGVTGSTINNALSGVMMRESLAPASRHAFVGYSKDWRSYFASHGSAGDTWSSAGWGTPAPSGQHWVKLVRVGNTITLHTSADGISWTQLHSATTAMGPNTYVGLQMTSASNSQLATATYSQVKLTTPPNLAPVVSAGPDLTVAWPATKRANLVGTISDDGLAPGLPSPSVVWSKVSGPGAVTFSEVNSSSTTATFSASGSYVLRLTGNDGIKVFTDDVAVNVSTATVPVMTDITTGLTLVQEINTATVAPSYESEPGISVVQTILGKQARVIPPGANAAAISYLVGQGQGLVAGAAYVLTIEYPDDVPRTTFTVNRGADYNRGWSTGKATGDIRGQFAEPAVESLNYPQTGQWQAHKQFFYLLNKFQGIVGKKDPAPGFRPYGPADGFNVVLFQGKQLNDPRSAGLAVGKIRLYRVTEPKSLYATINYPPADLPVRRIFWREEMSDQIVQSGDPATLAVNSPLDWHVTKMRMARVLGINTYCKDLLEFGYNQGWETGDQNWMVNAQPPNVNLWANLVPLATSEGLDILPYFEYKTGVGLTSASLANQRRAHKLYHYVKNTCNDQPNDWYTCIWWTEAANGDLTDPESYLDVYRMLDRTILDLKSQGRFAGVWFRPRGNHLPMSFADSTIGRFKADLASDTQAQTASQTTLISSYEGDKSLYNKYVNWWFGKRRDFLTAVRDYLDTGLDQTDTEVIYTPWASEPVPVPHATGEFYGHPGVVTDDTAWWMTFSNSMTDPWFKWHWYPTSFSTTAQTLYRQVMEERPPINHGSNYGNQELWHAAPGADPATYKSVDGVMMTYPIGRLFAVGNAALMQEYRSQEGLTVVRHYPLNEENEDPLVTPSPFGKLVGYMSVDCDRAGHHLLLSQARSIANADPRNIAYLCASSFSTGYPEILRRFNQAFLSVPAMPSTVIAASSDPEVVVRQITTPTSGTYYYVVNTSMNAKTGVTITLPASGTAVNLVTNETLGSTTFTVNLDSAELRSFRVGG